MSAELLESPQAESRLVDREAIRRADERIRALPPVASRVTIRRTPGLITREIQMEAGSEHRSKIHNSEHQFIVSAGSAFVSENDGPSVLMIAPFHGITKPGTWRQLLIVQPMVWTTMHPTDRETIDELENDIIMPEVSK
jgi:hypothetical protein